MSTNVIRIAKFAVSVVSAGLTLIAAFKKDVTMDEKIALKVAEEISKLKSGA